VFILQWRKSRGTSKISSIFFGLQNIVYVSLSPDRLILVDVLFRQKIVFDILFGNCHYNAITNSKFAMAKNYICKACDVLYDKTHKWDKTSSLCPATPSCTTDQSMYCVTWNRSFLSAKFFGIIYSWGWKASYYASVDRNAEL